MAIACRDFMPCHATFVDDVAGQGAEADIAPGDDAALGIADTIGGQQLQAVAGCDQPAIAKIAAGHGAEVLAGPQSALVDQIATGDKRDVAALDQRAIRCQAAFGLGQVEHRHQYLLAHDLMLFQPDDVVGQGRHLGRTQSHAQAQAEAVLAGNGVVHQVAVHRLVASQPGEEALAGTGDHRLADQALLVETVAQAQLRLVRLVAEVGEKVVRAHELLEIGECRVGLDQVFVRLRGRRDGHALGAGEV